MKGNVQNTKFQTPNTSKGITLVALVITIIILLILAGVAINMAINSDGLFGKANEATEMWNESVEKEETAISDLLTELDKVSPMEVEISTDIPEGWDNSKVQAVATAGSRLAPIPKGFTVSSIEGENTIGGGLVIYQGTEAVTGNKNSEEHINAMETRNQFVWIPVDDIDYMVMCKSNAEGSVCDLELVNGVLQCTNTAHTSTATNLCGRLYGTSTDTSKTPYTTSMNFADRTHTWSDSSLREPDIVRGKDTDDTTEGLTAFTEQMTNDFINMAVSVAKYGGFYVSRYEAGYEVVNGVEEKGISKKNKIVISAAEPIANPTVHQGVNMWYGLYNAVHKEITVGTSMIQSHMIYGSQYDQIINFLESNSSNKPQIGHSDRQLTTQGLTGANLADIMNNIYDLESNNREWTAQALSTDYRIIRGGNYVNASNGNFNPASNNRTNKPTDTYSDNSTRASLYL